ncbi:bifunctional metallophosphatase/5'-nucleotidase [Sporosarcina koreensis]|uniref:bifunctional metallophosphatase/5'-nucleotidase n=1 Tax=Sporosarcina koreensis TaxID=334735 RepID=UPI00075B2DE6|nr:bifunctional UDP-sugar hydrolase/5'-nucleotidase [Sporosarcina koreensis]
MKRKRMLSRILLAVLLLFSIRQVPHVSASFSDLPLEKNERKSATILYFNDGHEISPVVNQYGDRGGVARLMTVLESVRAEKGDPIVAFGGDLGGGTLFGGVFKGFPMVEAFNEMKINYANFGQHDFDAGVGNAKELVEQSEFQWVSSNLIDANGKPFANVPSFVIEERNGIVIGMIALTDSMHTTVQTDEVIQADLIESAKQAVEAIQEEAEVDVIVAYTQQPLTKDKELLVQVPEISYVFSEEEFENMSTLYQMEDRFVAKAEGNLGSVIQLDITKENDKITLETKFLKVNETVKPHEGLQKMANKYQAQLEKELGQTIATVTTKLDYGANHESRFQETNIGNLIADSFRNHYDADIGLMNGGGIRASIESGNLTLKDAHSVLPFGNKPVLAEIKGENIKLALENGVSKELGGGFLQVAGLSYAYEPSKPIGERVLSIYVGDEPLDYKKTYKVALPNFIFAGGDGYTMFTNDKILVNESNAKTDVEIFTEYVKTLATLDLQPEGRITVKQ